MSKPHHRSSLLDTVAPRRRRQRACAELASSEGHAAGEGHTSERGRRERVGRRLGVVPRGELRHCSCCVLLCLELDPATAVVPKLKWEELPIKLMESAPDAFVVTSTDGRV